MCLWHFINKTLRYLPWSPPPLFYKIVSYKKTNPKELVLILRPWNVSWRRLFFLAACFCWFSLKLWLDVSEVLTFPIPAGCIFYFDELVFKCISCQSWLLWIKSLVFWPIVNLQAYRKWFESFLNSQSSGRWRLLLGHKLFMSWISLTLD